jgi:hypothetical protein
MYDNDEKTEYVLRGYLSQLQDGVFFYPGDIPDFFVSTFKTSAKMPNQSPQNTTVIKSAVAELRRSGGFWNLPVILRVVPLNVKYCTFSG